MTRKGLVVTMHIDGGARGNPGPAAAGVVLRDAADGQVVHEAGHFLGRATNNVAEYSALVAGLEAAGRLGADEVQVFSDSELLVRQMNGQYRVKNAALQALYGRASRLCEGFRRCTFQHVRREQNDRADRLVNQAIQQRRDVQGAAGPD